MKRFAYPLLAAVAFAVGAWTSHPAAIARVGDGSFREDVPEHYGLGKPVRNETLLERRGYCALHDNTRKIPLWAAYHLAPAYIAEPRQPRLPATAFTADMDLPEFGRATLSDYRRSGYDRGHMVPSGDQRRTEAIQRQSFLLSNIVPQDSRLNQHAWKALEDKVREWVSKADDAYVYVGPIPGANLRTVGNGRVVVPAALFKVVALKSRTGYWHAIGFVCDNADDGTTAEDWITRIADIELLTGFRFLTALPEEGQRRLKNALPKGMEDW